MYEAFVHDAPIDIRPFRDREEAVTWLLSEEATPEESEPAEATTRKERRNGA